MIISATSHTYRSRVDGTLIAQIEIAPNDQAAYLELFGRPGAPMALARLTPLVAQEHARQDAIDAAIAGAGKLIEKPKGGAYSKLAGMWCHSPRFYEFILPVYDRFMGGNGGGFGDLDDDTRKKMTEADVCRHAIVVLCGITSRAELDHNKEAADKFNRLIRRPYMASMSIESDD